ncbi:8240_t:CDS:2, partial [Acaulospora morrowiae]
MNSLYEICTQCERSTASFSWCQSCDPLNTTQEWTSGNKDIDNYIKEFQLKSTSYLSVIEWIPFNRLSNLHKIGSNFQALWLDGIRKVKNNTRSRILSYPVEVKKFNNSQINALEFIKEFKNYMQLGDNGHKLYGITQNTTNQFMIVFDYKRDIKCGKCTQCERYNTSKAWCQSCDPFKTTQGWTSENNDIDDCIKEFQLKSRIYANVIEWIPFNRLSNLRKIGSNFQALWLDGIRKVKNNTQSRTLPYPVEVKKFNNSQTDALEFIKEFKNYMQLGDYKCKIYGITQDTTTSKYMIVFDDFYHKRDIKFGKCTQCERYNTLEAWCQSCDPFKTTQGWTSGNSDIDDCIKEFQLKSNIYANVIEWIPFNRLSNLQKKGGNFQALWLDGIRKVENNAQSRTLSYPVEIKKFDNSQTDALEFIKEFKNYMQLGDDEHKLYGITQDTTNQFMIVFDYKRDSKDGKCTQCERYNTSEAWCQSCDPFKTTQGWTSGNKDIDDCIKEFQLKSRIYANVIEWIPFNRLSKLHEIGSNFQALWLDGIRKVENNTPSRSLPYTVEIKKFNDLQIDTLEFIKEFKNYMQLEDYKCQIYGITQDTTTNQYMIVFDNFYYKRNIKFGKCTQCVRNNTSEAWCQSCDPFKVTQGWNSGNNDIDDYIKEWQLKSTRYEDVIEWIPFNELSNLHKIGSNFQALWLDGIRKVENNTQSRTLSCVIKLEKLDDLQIDTLNLIKKLKVFMQKRVNERKICGITHDKTTGHYMIAFDDFYYKRDIIYGKCIQCGRYNTSEAWCQSCDLFKTVQGWTSGNNNIDECIKEFQLKTTKYEDVIEWIPFYKLSNLQKTREFEFKAQWLDGIRKVESLELKKFDDSQIDALEFIKKFKNYMQLKDIKLYGITQDTTNNQYMIVFDDFHYGRDIIYGKCAHCNRYNTSEAWCQSCDPLKVIQGWTSGKNDIDDCIKEFQLKSTRYKDVIEWIPFNRLSNLQKIDESKFYALWLDGIRKVKNNTRLRQFPCLVELQKFDGLQTDALEFIKEFKSFMQFENNGHKIFGITQNASSKQYMAVIDYCISKRDEKYGVCRWGKHYNTSRGWCQSCDPFETTQVWASESIDVDDCIKEFQFMVTEYDKVIEWIPFDRLNNIQQIGKGGFGSVFSANWIDGKRKVLNNGK